MKNYASGVKTRTEPDRANNRSRARTFAPKSEMKFPVKKPTSYLIVLNQITSN